jgi:hypothetical protein
LHRIVVHVIQLRPKNLPDDPKSQFLSEFARRSHPIGGLAQTLSSNVCDLPEAPAVDDVD